MDSGLEDRFYSACATEMQKSNGLNKGEVGMAALTTSLSHDSDSFQVMALPFLGALVCKVQDGSCTRAFQLAEGGKKEGDTTFSATAMTQKLLT